MGVAPALKNNTPGGTMGTGPRGLGLLTARQVSAGPHAVSQQLLRAEGVTPNQGSNGPGDRCGSSLPSAQSSLRGAGSGCSLGKG